MKLRSKWGYEIAAGFGQLEYGASVGYVSGVDGLALDGSRPLAAAALRKTAHPALEGYACRFLKPHLYKGKIEAFVPGCFAQSISAVDPIRFLLKHDESELLGTSADRLQLLQDDNGLGFRFDLKGHPRADDVAELVKSGWRAMSVGYSVLEEETKTFEGIEARMIRNVQLHEISLVKRGAVEQAHASLIDLATAPPLRDAMRSKALVVDGAATAFERAANRLRAALS